MKRIVLIISIVVAAGNTFGQNPQFSQYYAAPLLLAPSFAGNSLGTRVYMNYRDQWAKLPGSCVTYSLAIDNNFYSVNSGLGLVVMRDVVGTAQLGSTSLAGLYSYRFNIFDDWRVRPGISFLVTQRSLNYQRAIFPDQISTTGVEGSTIEQPTDPYYFFDASSSVVVYNRIMYMGLCVDNLLRPNASFARLNARLPMQWSQFGGINIPLTNQVGKVPEIINLNYLLKLTGNYYQMDVGVNWIRAPLLLGFAWRGLPGANGYHTYDALIFTVGLGFNSMMIGYSYDFTVSKLGPATGGSHEITFRIEFNEGKKSNRQGAIPCPDIVKFKMFGDKESFR